MKIEIERELYLNILRSKEYAPYLIFKKGNDSVFLDIIELPKKHYLPINGVYVDGFIFSGKIIDALSFVSDEKVIELVMID